MTTLFLVDDDEFIINSFRRIFTLKNEKYAPYFFTDPFKALEKLEDLTPDFLFTDISMKSMNGWELIKRFRVRSPRTKLIVISGDVDRTAATNQVDHFLEKPTPFAELIRIMEQEEE
jgi:two-component system, response regulator YesN